MASKKSKAAGAGDDIDELFEGIGNEPTTKKPSKPKPTTAASKAMADQDIDILAELEDQINTQQTSRPHTPRVKEATIKGSPARRDATATPPPGSDDKSHARKSTDSAPSLRASFTPSATSSEIQDSEKKPAAEQSVASSGSETGGGWWGGIFATATAAMKQAEAAVKEIQQNEDAKKWADQVRGNVGALRGLGEELRHRALPTFTNILHTIAPPISSHERLLIHITHDMVGYPSLDPLVHAVFSRVMAQVEGGDLLVIQRGQESSGRRHSSDVAAGWRDGPWWRQIDSPRELGLVKGLPEGTKLCRVSAEAYANEYFASHGGLEQAKVRATEPLSDTNPVRSSDLFLAVQAIAVEEDSALFANSTAAEKEKAASALKEQGVAEEMVYFAVYILDPVHEIEFSTLSQSMPAKWVRWLDAREPLTPTSGDEGFDPAEGPKVPDEIREIVESGGVDPREWVAEWVEETLGLSVGIVAQRYVARRMGVGEGGLGRGKQRAEEVMEDGAGEAARAGLI